MVNSLHPHASRGMNGQPRRSSFFSESVSKGHPDKVADQIADAVVDAVLAKDPNGRVACDAMFWHGGVVAAGQISTKAGIDYGGYRTAIINTLREIGYTGPSASLDADTCAVFLSFDPQSPDIAQGVDQSHEARTGQASTDELSSRGAGDSGMMFGFACRETPELMPLPITLANKLVRRLDDLRLYEKSVLPYLGPVGKAQVTVHYAGYQPTGVSEVVLSAEHADAVSQRTIRRDLIKHVITPIIPSALFRSTKILINPTGRFVIGGPVADTGLTGRKIIVDTYGGMARHGGGAFSGKDPTKVDRTASYMARYIAKNIVAAGLAERCEVQLAYAISVANPRDVQVDTFGTETISREKIVRLIRQHFDMSVGAMIRDLDLRKPNYRQLAAYGHFGRPELDLPWERLDKAEILGDAAKLRQKTKTA